MRQTILEITATFVLFFMLGATIYAMGRNQIAKADNVVCSATTFSNCDRNLR